MNNPHNTKDPIKSTESLYRRVKNVGEVTEYYYDKDGNVIFTDEAFRDGNKKPSLYRANKISNEPRNARQKKREGIVNIIAEEITSINGVISCDGQSINHEVKVIYDPSKGKSGIAHSLVIVEPGFTGTKKERQMAFLKLKTLLAAIATKNGWKLKPYVD